MDVLEFLTRDIEILDAYADAVALLEGKKGPGRSAFIKFVIAYFQEAFLACGEHHMDEAGRDVSVALERKDTFNEIVGVFITAMDNIRELYDSVDRRERFCGPVLRTFAIKNLMEAQIDFIERTGKRRGTKKIIRESAAVLSNLAPIDDYETCFYTAVFAESIENTMSGYAEFARQVKADERCRLAAEACDALVLDLDDPAKFGDVHARVIRMMGENRVYKLSVPVKSTAELCALVDLYMSLTRQYCAFYAEYMHARDLVGVLFGDFPPSNVARSERIVCEDKEALRHVATKLRTMHCLKYLRWLGRSFPARLDESTIGKEPWVHKKCP